MSHLIPARLRRLARRALLCVVGPIQFAYIASAPLICARRTGFQGWYWRTVKRACSRLLRLLDIEVVLSEKDAAVLAADTGSIIVINHRSHLDGFALMDVLPDAKWITFAAKSEFFDMKLLGTGFRAAGLVPIERRSGSRAMQTLASAVEDMPERRSVVLFPEGTRTSDSALGPFKAGAVITARLTGRTIRPIVLHGSDTLLPRDRRLPRPGTIRVQVLPSFHCDPDIEVDADLARLRGKMLEALERD